MEFNQRVEGDSGRIIFIFPCGQNIQCANAWHFDMQLISCWSWNFWWWRPQNVNCNISERLWVPLTENLPALAFSEKLHFLNGVLMLLLLLVAVPCHQHACSLTHICNQFPLLPSIRSFPPKSFILIIAAERWTGLNEPLDFFFFLSCDVIYQYETLRLY